MENNPLTRQDLLLQKLADIKYLDMKATDVAKSKLSSEEFTGSIELTLEELAATKGVYLVEDLIFAESINFMIARSNLGKTFAYLDMSCRIVLEEPCSPSRPRGERFSLSSARGKQAFISALRPG